MCMEINFINETNGLHVESATLLGQVHFPGQNCLAWQATVLGSQAEQGGYVDTVGISIVNVENVDIGLFGWPIQSIVL